MQFRGRAPGTNQPPSLCRWDWYRIAQPGAGGPRTWPHQVTVWRVSNGSGAPFSGYGRYSRYTVNSRSATIAPGVSASGFCAAGPSGASKAQ
jgi:hypothetical protein